MYRRNIAAAAAILILASATGFSAYAAPRETEENQEAGKENTPGTKETVKEAKRNKRQERQNGQTVVQKPDAPKLDEDVQEEEGPGMQMGM